MSLPEVAVKTLEHEPPESGETLMLYLSIPWRAVNCESRLLDVCTRPSSAEIEQVREGAGDGGEAVE